MNTKRTGFNYANIYHYLLDEPKNTYFKELRFLRSFYAKNKNTLKFCYNSHRRKKNENLPSRIKSSIDKSLEDKKKSHKKLTPGINKQSLSQSSKVNTLERLHPNIFPPAKEDWVLFGDNKVLQNNKKQFTIRTSLSVINKVWLLLNERKTTHSKYEQRRGVSVSKMKEILHPKCKADSIEEPLLSSSVREDKVNVRRRKISIFNTRIDKRNDVSVTKEDAQKLPQLNICSKGVLSLKNDLKNKVLYSQKKNCKKDSIMNSALRKKKCSSKNVRVVFNTKANIGREYIGIDNEESIELEDKILQPIFY